MSIEVLAMAAVETLRVSIPTSFEGMLGTAKRSTCAKRIDSWSHALVEQAGIEIESDGLEHVTGREQFVVMSNHQSLYDIPILFQTLPLPLRMVAKKELFRIPFFGPAMRAAEIVKVDRSNRRQAMEAIERAKALIESGLSIWIAPEGTRSKDGGLSEFKKGGFHLALGTGARILPVTLVGTRHVMPAKTFRVQRGTRVRVIVSPPIDPADFGRKRLDELVTAVRGIIEARLPAEEEGPWA